MTIAHPKEDVVIVHKPVTSHGLQSHLYQPHQDILAVYCCQHNPHLTAAPYACLCLQRRSRLYRQCPTKHQSRYGV